MNNYYDRSKRPARNYVLNPILKRIKSREKGIS
jgi:hypothetical protein